MDQVAFHESLVTGVPKDARKQGVCACWSRWPGRRIDKIGGRIGGPGEQSRSRRSVRFESLRARNIVLPNQFAKEVFVVATRSEVTSAANP